MGSLNKFESNKSNNFYLKELSGCSHNGSEYLVSKNNNTISKVNKKTSFSSFKETLKVH